MHGFYGDYVVDFLADGRRVRLLRPLSYVDKAGKAHTVPAGFISDGGTIPRWLWPIVGSPHTGTGRRAYPIHDKECEDARAFTGSTFASVRRDADRTLREMLVYLGVKPWRVRAIYAGTRAQATVARLFPQGDDRRFAAENGGTSCQR